MKKNMGTIDKVIRVLVAAVLVVLYFAGVVTGVAGIVMLVVAGVFVLTSTIGICPLYLPFGLKTNK